MEESKGMTPEWTSCSYLWHNGTLYCTRGKNKHFRRMPCEGVLSWFRLCCADPGQVITWPTAEWNPKICNYSGVWKVSTSTCVPFLNNRAHPRQIFQNRPVKVSVPVPDFGKKKFSPGIFCLRKKVEVNLYFNSVAFFVSFSSSILLLFLFRSYCKVLQSQQVLRHQDQIQRWKRDFCSQVVLIF
jgi:hypothetical protein